QPAVKSAEIDEDEIEEKIHHGDVKEQACCSTDQRSEKTAQVRGAFFKLFLQEIGLPEFVARVCIDGIDRVLYPFRVLCQRDNFVGEHTADSQKGQHDDHKRKNDDDDGCQRPAPLQAFHQPYVQGAENGVHHDGAEQRADDSPHGIGNDSAQEQDEDQGDDVSLFGGKYGVGHSR